MHCIVTVIHKEGRSVDSLFDKFIYDNEEYYESTPIASKEQAFKDLSDRLARYKQCAADEKNDENVRTMYKNYADQIEALVTDEQKIEYFIEDSGNCYYDDQLEEFYENYNPYGYCDWYVIGGRWSGSLVDYQGVGHDTLPIKDFNKYNPDSLNVPYGYLLDYLDESYIEESVDEKKWDEVLNDALVWGEQHGEDLYITLVDIHQ